MRVRGTGRTRTYAAFDANDELTSQTLGFCEYRGLVRIEHDL